MISFFVHFYYLCRTLVRGLRDDPDFRALMILFVFILGGGTIFYWQVEHWTFVDSLYFCVMTISTIGYGDLVPSTGFSKIFTIIYAVSGIGLFVSVVGKLVRLQMNQRSERIEKRRGKKQR